jgi:hypothetical protein
VLYHPLPAPQQGLHDQVRQLHVLGDHLLQPVHRDFQHRPGFPDNRGGEHPLSGQDAQLGNEPARAKSDQLPLYPGFVVNHGDRPRQDHEELVSPVSLTKQHLPRCRRPRLAVAAQQRELLIIQLWGQVRICSRIRLRHPGSLVTMPFIALPPIKVLVAKATDISAAGPLGQRYGELGAQRERI